MVTCGVSVARVLRMAALAAAAALILGQAQVARAQTAAAPDLQAAFLLNFARFTEWPSSEPGMPVRICVFRSTRVADALDVALRGQTIDGRPVALVRLAGDGPLASCHLLFVGADSMQGGRPLLERAGGLPILTVSDRAGFAASSGIVELFVEDGRMRFAINIDAAARARLHLSSRLLGLARIVRGRHAL